MTTIKTHYRTCNLCEAMCGLKIEHQGETILSIKGDDKDPFSQGHICPKAVGLKDLFEDPDRLKAPIERTEAGWQVISWQRAFDLVSQGVQRVQKTHGKNAFGVYLGNPNVHNLGGMLTLKYLLTSLQSRNRFSATSIDQLPHHIIAHDLFGHQLRIPVPDINRTDFMLILGANPVASNGSIMSVANVKQKIKDIKNRAGSVVVIDPRKTETAALASEHIFIKPGTDVLLLLAMLNELFKQKLVKQSRALDLCVEVNLADIEAAVRDYSCEYAQQHSGVDAQVIRSLVTRFTQAKRPVCYGRMGVSVQQFGLLSQYLIMLLNLLTGRVDEEGGLMFPNPAADIVNNSGPGYFSKRLSRVRQLPDFNGEFPVATLAEEILEPGDGQIKAMVTVAGNPILSTPNGRQLDKAFESLDFMFSIDYYLNETTRHAHVILPPVSPLQRDHYDITFHNLAVHNTSKFSEALFKPGKNEKHDWQIYLALSKRLKPKTGFVNNLMRNAIQLFGPNVLLNSMLKRGPYSGLSLAKIKKHPHGLDLGPMTQSLPQALFHKDKKINLKPEFYFKDLIRVNNFFKQKTNTELNEHALLIGRRDVRSNNSWMHNAHRLVKGKNRCTLLIHPDHAAALGVQDGQIIQVRSRTHALTVTAQISEEIMPGVISIPHGWGHNRSGTKLSVAEHHAGVSVNDLTDDRFIDELSGNAAVNGVPVTLSLAI